MNKTASLLKGFLPSLVMIAASVVAAAAGLAPRFASGAAEMIDFSQLCLGIVIVALVAFAFGLVRYNLSVGWTLALVSLHDLLLTLAVVTLCSLALPQSLTLPVLVMFVPVFTFVSSLTVIRAARDLRAANSQRDMSSEDVAGQATASTRSLRLRGALLALLFIVAGTAFNLKLAGALLPLLVGLAVSLMSSCLLTGKLWLATGSGAHKTAKR